MRSLRRVRGGVLARPRERRMSGNGCDKHDSKRKLNQNELPRKGLHAQVVQRLARRQQRAGDSHCAKHLRRDIRDMKRALLLPPHGTAHRGNIHQHRGEDERAARRRGRIRQRLSGGRGMGLPEDVRETHLLLHLRRAVAFHHRRARLAGVRRR